MYYFNHYPFEDLINQFICWVQGGLAPRIGSCLPFFAANVSATMQRLKQHHQQVPALIASQSVDWIRCLSTATARIKKLYQLQ
jgi:hypothetical protein